MIFVIDNYDSFVFNLARYVRRLGRDHVEVIRNDELKLDQLPKLPISAVVISPGPCGPDQAGETVAVVQALANQVPILGVCLGHQVIVRAFGGKIVRAARPMHGQASNITHQQHRMFTNIPSPFTAGRYHSLIANADTLPDCLQVTAQLHDRTIMAIAHRSRPIWGVQFHPESILTPYGEQLIYNFLELANLQSRAATVTSQTQPAGVPLP